MISNSPLRRLGHVTFVSLVAFILGGGTLFPSAARALDWRYEGRFLAASEYLWNAPATSNDFNHQIQLRNGLVGDVWSSETALLDFEFIFQSEYRGGAVEQAGFVEEWDLDVFRGWLRFEKDRFRLRGGRQAILFGPGQLFRPLGLFDDRLISGVIPQTTGVDGLRATYFTDRKSVV